MDTQLERLLARTASTFEPPVLHLGCGSHELGDVRVDFTPGAANVIANLNEQLPIRTGSVATVFSRCFFEHVRNPGFLLREIARVLKPRGLVVIITDNAGYVSFHLEAKVGTPVHRPGGYRGVVDADQHYALYTDAHLLNHLDAAGFTDAAVHYVDAVEIGRLSVRPPLQRTYAALHRRIPRASRYVMPYLTPHLLAVARKLA